MLAERRDGTRRLYSIRPEAIESVRDFLDELWPSALGRLKSTVEGDRRTAATHEVRVTVDDYRTEIRIEAAPAEVFPYLTEADLMIRWMGDWADLDPVSGGRFVVDINGVPIRGRYVAVEPPRRVVFSWGAAGNERHSAGVDHGRDHLAPGRRCHPAPTRPPAASPRTARPARHRMGTLPRPPHDCGRGRRSPAPTPGRPNRRRESPGSRESLGSSQEQSASRSP